MPFSGIRPTKISLAVLAVISFLILISLIIVSKIIIPREVRSYVEEFSKDKGYKVEVGKIGFDFFSGLKGKEIGISDPVSTLNPILTVERLVIKPDILSSLINRRIIVGRITIDKPSISLTREELNKLVKLAEKKDKEKEDKEKKEKPFPVKRLEINDARIELPSGVLLTSKEMEVHFKDADSNEEKTVKVSGSVALKDKEMEIEGQIKPFLDAPTGELKIKLAELNTESFSTALKPVELSVFSDLRFQISDDITSQGVINFVPSETNNEQNSALSGKLDYDLTYDKSADTVFIQSADLDVDQLIHLSITGTVEDIRKGAVFNLSGGAEDIRLENVPDLFPDLSNVGLSGDAEINDIRVTGSKKDENVSLSGNAVLSQVNIHEEKRGFQVNGLEGSFEFNKAFEGQDFSAQGNFSLQNVETKIGELSGVSGKVEFATDDKDKRVNLSSLKASFLGGVVSGDVEFKTLNGKKMIWGDLKGVNLNLNKIPEDYISAHLEGSLEAINAKFTSEDMEEFSTGVSLSIRDLELEAGESVIIKASRAKSIEPLRVKFSLSSENSKSPDGNFSGSRSAGRGQTLRQGQNRITVESKGISYANLSFNDFRSEKGNLSELLFKLGEESGWVLNTSLTGSQLQMSDEAHFGWFRGDINTEGNGGVNVWGSFNGKGGVYKNFSFPTLSTNFKFNDNLLQFTNLKARLESYGELGAKKVDLLLGNQENNGQYRVTFSQGNFSGFDEKIQSDGIKGEFVFHTGAKETWWNGNVFAHETNVTAQKLEDISLRIKSSQDGINLERISGRFLQGDLTGSMFIRTAESPTLIFSQVELEKALIPLNNFDLSLGKLNFNFKGNLQENSFPEGNGEVSFSNLNVEKDKVFSPLRGEIKIQTAGETISLEEGFIQNEEGMAVSLTGRMENTLNGNRRLQFNLPQVPLGFLKKTLSPVLPQVLKGGEFKGNLGLDLVSNHFLQKEASWNGEVSIRDVSFDGQFNDTHFLINDINGTIPLRDGEKSENLLAHLTGRSPKLGEKTFEDFLRIVNQDETGNRRDFLRIKEIEYGFLRLEDIECEVELNGGKINLKRLKSELYRGRAFGAGLFDLSGGAYDLLLLLDKVSLESISNSIPSTKDYITGRINGIAWVRGEGKELSTVDGSFNFWAIKSKKEPRRIGKAFLQQLGVKEKFFLRSYRKYDKGKIQGYVKNGVITFKELNISHKILGLIEDLSIRVDVRRNSISVAHLLSVIRETAKRASKGELKIEYK